MRLNLAFQCDENWEKMLPMGEGRHCEQCDKVILDFRDWSDAAIIKRLQKGDKLCGRIPESLLERSLKPQSPKRNPVMALSLLSAMASSGTLMAQEAPSSPREVYQSQGYKALDKAEFAEDLELSFILEGKVLDSNSSHVVPFANLIIKQAGTIIAYSNSDLNGEFNINLGSISREQYIEITTSMIGMETRVMRLMPEDLNGPLSIEMLPAPLCLEADVIAEAPMMQFLTGIVVALPDEYHDEKVVERNWWGRNWHRTRQFANRLKFW